jgi:hypothetical protein
METEPHCIEYGFPLDAHNNDSLWCYTELTTADTAHKQEWCGESLRRRIESPTWANSPGLVQLLWLQFVHRSQQPSRL